MRPIKFRGKRKDSVWIYGYYCQADNRHYITSNSHESGFSGGKVLTHDTDGWMEVIPETVGQDTGLKDKNGREACKFDIIKGIHKATGERIVGEVVWHEMSCGWGLKLEDWTMGFQCLSDCYDFEVIGNIHENPELLKEDKK